MARIQSTQGYKENIGSMSKFKRVSRQMPSSSLEDELSETETHSNIFYKDSKLENTPGQSLLTYKERRSNSPNMKKHQN